MKKISFLLCLLVAFGLYACTQDEAFVDGTPSKGLTAEIPTYQFEGNSTRVNISKDLLAYTWKDGDEIGIYQHTTTNDASAVFRINQGGSSSGVFSNESFSLKPNSTYYAFYPYAYNATVDAYPVDFTGQVQTANGSTAHIGARNYMSAVVNTDNNGSAFIAFQNQASVIQLQLPIEDDGTYTSVTLSTVEADFIAKGSLNMKTGEITSTEMSQQMKVSFGKGIALNEGDKLTVNVLVAPVDLTGKTFTVSLEAGSKVYNIENLEGKNFQKGKAYKVECESGKIGEIPYLTFTTNAGQTLRMSKAIETLEYSVNNGVWQTLGTSTVSFGGANGNLRLRGKGSKGTAYDFSNYSKIYFGNVTKVACSGDIRTLVDYENYKEVNTNNARFCHLFENCSVLTSAPSLPAEALADDCYSGMFYGCSSLTSAPSLPAETLADYCYLNMFYGCSSLTSVPSSLPAPILADNCYKYMFYGCSSLTSAPSLPAETLADYCYYLMFYGCSSLTSAPSLPAETLAESCYSGMFSGCSSLTSAPSLPAKTLASFCYESMFSGCSSLTSAPSLPAETLVTQCYSAMFRDCSSLMSAPSLPAETLADRCYYCMFQGCSSLTSAPSLPAETLAYGCYSAMFEDCTSLTSAPSLPAEILAVDCYSAMFNGCSNLNYIKMLATDISATGCLDYWTSGVSSTGTFIKSKDATWSVSGDSGIPTNWTVQTE